MLTFLEQVYGQQASWNLKFVPTLFKLAPSLFLSFLANGGDLINARSWDAMKLVISFVTLIPTGSSWRNIFIDSDSVLSLINTIASCLLNTTYYQIFVEQVAITLVTFLWTHNYLAFDHLGAFGQLLEDDDRLWQVLHHTVGHVSL